MKIEDTLKQRGKKYGEFYDAASIAQSLKTAITREIVAAKGSYEAFDPDMREAVEMFCVKLARIINGDNNYPDNWHDIAGYAMLVANRLESEQKDK
jgi:Domain of unknown function (DUF6378)